MMVEAVQTYVKLVNGLTRATRERARAAAHDLLAQVGLEGVANDYEQRAAKLTEEILSASRANRDLLEKLVSEEVTKGASRLGFVRFDDLDELREEIAELRAQLARQQPAAKAPARKAAAKRAPAKKAPATKSPATTAEGAAQRLAAEREAAPARRPAAPRTARARRTTTTAPDASTPVVPDPAADAGA